MLYKDKITKELISVLIKSAFSAREKSYAPYSKFHVGAAVLADDDKIYTGCNVENASYPAGSCAETIAVNKAVSEGVRAINAVAIVGGADKVTDFIYPCGICRQVISEFKGSEGVAVIIAKSEEDYKVFDISELLPGAFSSDDMN
ncbi:cytidine deaminase [Eubacterium ruminantium]|uniref:Cytidine deaminase n=1 Tax=Eubacterium ruminantium TaxID=42322 RepID=A0A1T4KKH8_9FIRM|nr:MULTISPECIES: cytidine deaminase [Eubacterium]MCR5367050.1 cytidine deaminase [Eubacterium sp.]SCW32867.1 cytidine deaminase [Eubacterium ruminantium]SDM29199.1 cytidine deaminase [Eubacterium ruminantium]SJZ42942.1 cytidine deaminase [Eubacterium ruminantium]